MEAFHPWEEGCGVLQELSRQSERDVWHHPAFAVYNNS
jgi:pterin-4a-carbinolamine dehydratase